MLCHISNIEEEVIVIHNEWTPWKEGSPNTVFDFSKTDFDGLRDHFSNYNDWAVQINLDINEGWNLIKKRICDGMIKFIHRVTLKKNK